MATEWQSNLPIAKESKLNPNKNETIVWGSPAWTTYRRPRTQYRTIAVARWDDRCGNGSNSFHLSIYVAVASNNRPADYAELEDAPDAAEYRVPERIKALKKWNGCHTFGPWAYFENTKYHAGDRDCWGLCKGEKQQITKGGVTPSWELHCTDAEGNPVHLPEKYVDSHTPPSSTGLRL